MVGLLDLYACGQSDVMSAERRGVFGDLQLSRCLQSGEEENQCGWSVVLSFASLSLSLSQNWSSSLLVVCVLLICQLSINLSFISFFSSDPIKLGFHCFFYHKGHRLAEKLLLIIFIFQQISSGFRNALILCVETPFSILKKVSALITSGECSCGH